MNRLLIAKRELRAYLSDRLTNRAVMPLEVTGLAKVREALALIDEAQMVISSAEYGGRVSRELPPAIVRDLEKLDERASPPQFSSKVHWPKRVK